MEKVYTAQDVSRYLKLHIVVVRNYIRDGQLKGSKVGTKWLVTEAALKEFLESREASRYRFAAGNVGGRINNEETTSKNNISLQIFNYTLDVLLDNYNGEDKKELTRHINEIKMVLAQKYSSHNKQD